MRYLLGLGLGLSAALLVTSCNGSSSSASTGPSLVITAPKDGASVTVDAANPDVPISFTVKNFTLKDPGTCAGAPACGYVQVSVDGDACNDPAPHPYNNVGASSPVTAGLDYCPTLDGAHEIKLELVFDDGVPVTDAMGTTIGDSVAVTAVAGSAQVDAGVPGQDGGSAACPGGGAPVATTSVTVSDFKFSPKCITVSPGATVTWTNTGMPTHTVTSDTGAPVTFDSGALGTGGTFHFTFSAPDTVGYHCIPHQAFGMTGTVIVE